MFLKNVQLVQLMVGYFMLKHLKNLGNETLAEAWMEICCNLLTY